MLGLRSLGAAAESLCPPLLSLFVVVNNIHHILTYYIPYHSLHLLFMSSPQQLVNSLREEIFVYCHIPTD